MPLLPLHKPSGPSSHDMVFLVRSISGVQRVGHAGTLDPLAEGVLLIAVGRYQTRQIASHVASEKEYIATICLGATSSTDDKTGVITPYHTIGIPSEAVVGAVVRSYIGIISQRPPNFSAVHIGGKRAYKLARRDIAITLPPRNVSISAISILEYSYPMLRLAVTCGPGVYIRSLARDIGEDIGVGGYIEKLVRSRVGDMTLALCIPPEAVPSWWQTTGKKEYALEVDKLASEQ